MTIPAQLTILEEFLLLALDDEAGHFYSLPQSTLDCACAGAVMMDLTLRRRIDNDLKNLFIIDTAPVDDNILDPVLQTMALAPVVQPHSVTHWLRQLMAEGEALREQGLQRLVDRGILVRQDKKIMWMFGTRRYPMVDDTTVREVKWRILGVILRDEIPAPHDMMLTALAQACGLFRHILSPSQLDSTQTRIELVARMDLIGQAVAKSVTEIEAAIAMASGFR